MIEALPDACRTAFMDQVIVKASGKSGQRLGEKQKLLFAPMSDVKGNIMTQACSDRLLQTISSAALFGLLELTHLTRLISAIFLLLKATRILDLCPSYSTRL